ncbi:hypothetical protein AZA_88005 [Nitrospirillum viridazoti Y2]|uniref:Phage tail assembly chaperone n=1 Tax=Nitrospirillum amazonense TaxID=28077 RepID=A0A560II02_9PROT|nr:phage tail assembly chaperone [Nitrospirillum amazonense]EGY02276.1 hypothetical protein AZA_88005 [Nitrospirillum amazonense Y2]TWB58673.1 phage tail assembly chaperone [Nitrospirillum amazonense]
MSGTAADEPQTADLSAHYYADYDPATGQFMAIHTRDPLSPLIEGVGVDGVGRKKVTDAQAATIWGSRLVDDDIVPKGDADLALQATAAAMDALREHRGYLLSLSDIRVLPDRWAAMTDTQRSAWALYRQALRDLPETCTTPASPIWPVPPT